MNAVKARPGAITRTTTTTRTIREEAKNWFDCIRSGKQPNANIELALKVQTVVSLAEMSDRLRITCLFDAESRRITDGTGREIAPITYGTMRGS